MNLLRNQDSRKRQTKKDDAIRKRIEHDLSKKKKNGSYIARHKRPMPGTVLSLKPNEPITCKATATVYEVSQLMIARRENCVLVVGEEGDLMGIFTAKDLAFRVVGAGLNASNVTINKIMTPNPICTMENNPASDALTLMVDKGFRHLPVKNELQQVVGILDITNCYAQQMEKLERMHNSSKKLYEALDSVQTEIGLKQHPQQVFEYFEKLRSKMNGPTLETVLDEQTAPIYVSVKATVLEATVLMKENNTTAVLVKDTNEELTGIFTSKDVVLRVIAAGLEPKQCSVVRVMTPQPDMANANLPIQQALRQMFNGHYLNLPVFCDGANSGNEDDISGDIRKKRVCNIIGIVDVLKLTCSTLNQIKQLELDDFMPEALVDSHESLGPAWSKFWTELGNEDTISNHSEIVVDMDAMHNGEGVVNDAVNDSVVAEITRHITPTTASSTATAAAAAAVATDAATTEAAPLRSHPELSPSDSVSRANSLTTRGFYRHSIGGPLSSRMLSTEDIMFVFKFRSPGHIGKVHRVALAYGDGIEKLKELIGAKLQAKDFEALGVNRSVKEGTYIVSYLDDENDIVSITSDYDLLECVRVNRKLGKEKADIYLSSLSNHIAINEARKCHKRNNRYFSSVMDSEYLLPSIIAILASSAVVGFTLSRR